MNLPLVSICIITFNQKDFIRETLNSVLDQDYENFEIIVADDGSIDGTDEIILEYAQKSRGRIIPQVGMKNVGITGNCNRGLSACKGKYIAFLGGDDLFLPGKIRAQVEFMEANPNCDVCYHDVEIFESASGKVISLFSQVSRPTNGGIREAIKAGSVNCASASMYRGSKTPKTGFDISLPVVSDWFFTIQTLAAGGQFCFIHAVLAKYRRHPTNVSNIDSPFRMQGFLDLLHTCALCIRYYPQYLSQTQSRMSEILRESRKLNGGEFYSSYLWASLRMGVSFKTIAGLAGYYLTAKRLKL
jgi:glycosyltransferase involved in cell wall biosynthesis